MAGLLGGVIGGLMVIALDGDGGGAPAGTPAPPDDVASDVRSEERGAGETAGAVTAAVRGTVESAVQRVLPGIVRIEVAQEPRQDAGGFVVEQGGIGTGLVLDESGYILTNEHVIRGAVRVDVTLADGEVRRATFVGSDAPFTDIAVLRIEPGGLQPVPFGASAELRLGQTVVAVGISVLERGPTVTVGVVSGRDVALPREDYVQEHLIQTDAALNHGNSGGALVTLEGAVVGLTTTVSRRTDGGDLIDGVGFALQADVILPIARRIVAEGSYPRPDLGVVEERTVTPLAAAQVGLSVERGSFLVEITRNGPLALAGVRPGDILLALGGALISEERPYVNVLSRIAPGQPIEVVYLSGDDERRVSVTPDLRAR